MKKILILLVWFSFILNACSISEKTDKKQDVSIVQESVDEKVGIESSKEDVKTEVDVVSEETDKQENMDEKVDIESLKNDEEVEVDIVSEETDIKENVYEKVALDKTKSKVKVKTGNKIEVWWKEYDLNKLESLDLRSNNIWESWSKAIADVLKVNKTIKNIDIWRNRIWDVWAKAIAEALKYNTKLIQIDLWKNNIWDKWVKALAEMLKVNDKITELNLRWNKIKFSWAKALADVLKVNKTLTNISLMDNKIWDFWIVALVDMMKTNKKITNMDLRMNKIWDKWAEAIEDFWDERIKYTKMENYWIELNLKYIREKKYELIWEDLWSNINSIEILSCIKNNSEFYDTEWYKLKTYKKWDNRFSYKIDQKYNNYCLIPYKIKIVFVWNKTEIITKNFNLDFVDYIGEYFGDYAIREFNWLIDLITFKLFLDLKKGHWMRWLRTAIDKNYIFFIISTINDADINILEIKDYLSYKVIGWIVVWDGVEYTYGKRWLSLDSDIFEKMSEWYFKDKNNFYHMNWRNFYLVWSNKKKLTILSDTVYKYDGSIYYYGKKLENVDIESFEVVDIKKTGLDVGYNWDLFIFAEDNKNLYFESSNMYWTRFEKALKWDYESFTNISSEIAIDKDFLFIGLYQNPHNFDMNTFKNIWDLVLYDKDQVYFWDKKTNINSSEFKIYWSNQRLLIIKIKEKLYYNCNTTKEKMFMLLDYLEWKNKQFDAIYEKRPQEDDANYVHKIDTGWRRKQKVDFESFKKINDLEFEDKNWKYNFGKWGGMICVK